MAIVFVNDESLAAIADAIRSKNGSTDTYYPNKMAEAIEALGIQKCYVSTEDPDDSIGSDGDLWLKTT